MKFLIMALFFILRVTSAEAASCPKGEHWVSSHHRSAYYRHDGVFVSATERRLLFQSTAECTSKRMEVILS